jgi:ABC-type multidrug transport system fused ATPase/permease subunit
LNRDSTALLPLLRRVLGYVRPHAGPLAAGTALTLVGIALDLVKPLPLAIVIDAVLSGKPLEASLVPLLGGLSQRGLLVAAAVALVGVTLLHGSRRWARTTSRSTSGSAWSTTCARTCTRTCRSCR